jgi:putative DNA primase/helicase
MTTITERVEGNIRETLLACSEHELTEALFAGCFASIQQGKLRYVEERRQWLIYDSGRWRAATRAEVQNFVLRFGEFISSCADEMSASANKHLRHHQKTHGIDSESIPEAVRAMRKRSACLRKALQKVQSRRGIDNLLELASRDERIALRFSELDGDGSIINLMNGLFDLETMKLLEHSPEQLVTKMMGLAFDPTAKCPEFRAALERTFRTNPDVIEFLQRFLGYCLTDEVGEEVFLLFLGFGSNGKSVLCNVIRHLWGDYAIKAAPSLLSRDVSRGGPSPEIVALKGIRAAVVTELPAAGAMSENTVKEMVSREALTGRGLYEGLTTFFPTHKIIASSNHRPNIRGTEDGIWRRIISIPFNEKFDSSSGGIANLDRVLRDEASGIFNWVVEGLRLYRQKGLTLPPSLVEEKIQFREESNLVGNFLDTACRRDSGLKVRSQHLYDAFTHFCELEGLRCPYSQKIFCGKLRELGFEEGKSNGLNVWKGLDFDRGSVFYLEMPPPAYKRGLSREALEHAQAMERMRDREQC